MTKRNKKRTRKIKNLIIICTLNAVILSVSTYAWFVGMQSVNVSNFDVEIATTDSLLLSLDGETWDTTINISQATLDDDSYIGHTNSWGGRGLIPMSSVGEIDTAVSRLKLFEKASLTATPGGYRIMASRVNNYDANPEQEGYVTFDLFIKNLSGNQYINELNELEEEAIYLTVDSEVKVSAAGVANTGIENSVRVAFAQIGRVSGTTNTQETITGIVCEPTVETEVTGICRTAQIWEPNDTFHEAAAISYYNTFCATRTGDDVMSESSYEGVCGTVTDGVAYPTYAIKDEISLTDAVNVYDGEAYNSYVPAEPSTPLLHSYPCFTDTKKLISGSKRPQFMTLAANSITKVRVYIYLEGQDIDNYDFASIGKSISIKFGFTKSILTEDDIAYNGPDINQGDGPSGLDKTSPVIKLKGDNIETINLGESYSEPGFTASDNIDGNVTGDVIVIGTVNTNLANTYNIIYKVTDSAGNTGFKTRKVIVT